MLRNHSVASSSLAIFTDTHFWADAPGRARFAARAAALRERDGLVVHHTPAIVSRLLRDVADLAARGGVAAVHLGDAGCGGGGFDQPAAEYVESLRALRAMEAAALPSGWAVHHLPGNHDVAPAGSGGLAAVRRSGSGSGSSRSGREPCACCERAWQSSDRFRRRGCWCG